MFGRLLEPRSKIPASIQEDERTYCVGKKMEQASQGGNEIQVWGKETISKIASEKKSIAKRNQSGDG
jgi:hypothetical protein